MFSFNLEIERKTDRKKERKKERKEGRKQQQQQHMIVDACLRVHLHTRSRKLCYQQDYLHNTTRFSVEDLGPAGHLSQTILQMNMCICERQEVKR